MNLDITFCAKINCKNKKCERNQVRVAMAVTYIVSSPITLNVAKCVTQEMSTRYLSIGEFPNCEYWEDKNERT